MLSVIIPSKTDKNLGACVAAIRGAGETCRVIVADDFDGPTRFLLPEYEPVDWQMGIKPFIFSRNVNIGINAGGRDDVVLLNDDALLRTDLGFTAMHRAAHDHPEFGIISSTTNLAGNLAQQPRGEAGIRFEPGSVAFVCVLITRLALDTVGLLDERFTAYGWEDNDYCRRIRNAGMKVGIFDGCYVDHGSLRSTFRGDPRAPGSIAAGAAIYRDKWGDNL